MSYNEDKKFDINDYTYNELIGRFDSASAKSLKEKCGDHNRINLNTLWFSENALITLGNAFNYIASLYPITKKDLTMNSAYNVDNDLIFIFRLPHIDAENIVTIPNGHWGFKSEFDENKGPSINYHSETNGIIQ